MSNMESNITIASVNCQGLNNTKKRRDVFHYLRNKKFSVYFLQDTHFENKMEQYILSEWGYQGYFSSHTSNARGVGILFNNNFEFKIKQVVKGDGGNSLMVLVEIKQKDFLFVNIYGPNKDEPDFYNNLAQKIKLLNVSNVIIGGDFNLVLDPSRDYHNYKHVNNPKARETVEKMITELQLNDIWRDLNPDCHRYTWRRSNPLQQARLDFFLASDNIISLVDDADIEYGYRTDHSLILLKLKFCNKTKTSTFWKFNSSLLKDQEYLKAINEEIKQVKEEYAASPYAREAIDEIPLSELQLSISDELFLDFLLMKIRTKTISYASIKKKNTAKEENELENEIKQLETKEIKTNVENETLNFKQEQLKNIREKRMEGVLLRSKARWILDGEKVSNYFCNLEKRHYISKNMAKLIDAQENVLKDQQHILQEVQSFYEKLYSKREVENCNIKDLITDIPRLDEDEASMLEGELTLEEAAQVLKNMKNNKSPGTDRFTAEFFKVFWSRLGTFVVRALNAGFSKGELSSVQKQGIIVCIPKGDKPREYIKNWRPISLLNTVYKIGSSCVANRIKTFLCKLINEDQTGFVRNRYIGDNIRLIYDTIAYLEEHDEPGLLLNIDFEKAFDSISWDFMFKVLNVFGFKSDICKWINIFYNSIKSCVIVNGQISKWFNIERGCRQGDPLSPYLFILCVEILGIMIRENKDIHGIQIANVEHKLTQYADDTEFLLAGDRKSFETCIETIQLFGKKSGLNMNPGKTSVVWLGSRKNSTVRYMEHLKMEWNPEQFRILGILFTNDLKKCVEINYEEKLADVKNLFKIWAKRQLTPLGRIAVLKSLILSKLIHLWMLLPNPPDEFLKTLQTICYKFVWNSKPDKINRKTVHKSIKNGGLGLPELKVLTSSLKLTWLRKALNAKNKWRSIIESMFPILNQIEKYGPEIIETSQRYNTFWAEVLEAYKQFFYKVVSKNSTQLLAEPVFYNNKIQIGKHFILGKRFINHGIFCVGHFVIENGDFVSYDEFKQKFNVRMDVVTFFSLKSAIREYIRTTDISINHNKYLNVHKCFSMLISTPKGSKMIYDILIDNNKSPKCCESWDERLEIRNDWKSIFLNASKLSDIGLKWFQLKIIHRCLGTNVILKQIGVLNNDRCSFCNTVKDSIRHMFWQCTFIQHFWTDLMNIINTKCPNALNYTITEPLAITGHDAHMQTDTIMYFIIILGKQYIYKCKLENKGPLLQGFLAKLKHRYSVEEYIARKNLSYNEFNVKWHPYKALFS